MMFMQMVLSYCFVVVVVIIVVISIVVCVIGADCLCGVVDDVSHTSQ